MSQATAFIEALQSDTALRNRASQLRPDDVEGLIDMAALHGFAFTREDWQQAVREFAARQAAGPPGSLSRVPGFRG